VWGQLPGATFSRRANVSADAAAPPAASDQSQAKVLEAAREALGTDEVVATDTDAPLPMAPAAAAAAASAAAAAASAAPKLAGGGPAAPSAPGPSRGGAPAARSVVGRVGTGSAAPGAPASPGPDPLTRRWSPMGGEGDLTRHVLQNALDKMQRSGGAPSAGAGASGGTAGAAAAAAQQQQGGGEGGAPPSWAATFLSADGPTSSADAAASAAGANGSANGSGTNGNGAGAPPASGPRLQLSSAPGVPQALAFAEPEPPAPTAALLFVSQEAQDRERARSAVLPPLQSIVELTSAFRPPERGGALGSEVDTAVPEAVTAGRALADGAGALADGSTWEKKSGIEYGEVRGRGVGRPEGVGGLRGWAAAGHRPSLQGRAQPHPTGLFLNRQAACAVHAQLLGSAPPSPQPSPRALCPLF
jgi:hypothetical protein